MPRDRQTVIQRSLDKRRVVEADINHRVYVRPLGQTGMHVLKNRNTGIEFIASGPKRTFRPGETVPTGSHTGTGGEVILVEPPPGKRGPSVPGTSTVFVPADPGNMRDEGNFVPASFFVPLPPTVFQVDSTLVDSEGGITTAPAGQGLFTASSFVVIAEERDNSGSGGWLGNVITGFFFITAQTFVSTERIDVTVITKQLPIANYAFRFGVWNAAPPSGTIFREDYRIEAGVGDLDDPANNMDTWHFIDGV